MLENSKTGASRESFQSENDFEISSAVNFLKKHPDFQLKKWISDLIFFAPSTYELNIKFVLGT